MVTVKYDDLSMAFDFVSFGGLLEHRAFVSLDTGTIYYMSDTGAMEDSELPDDVETSGRYVEIPHKNELALGNDLVFGFVDERLPDRYGEVRAFFRRPGAYARFKALLASEDCLEDWYAFEAKATKRALREWCNENGIHLAEDAVAPSNGEKDRRE